MRIYNGLALPCLALPCLALHCLVLSSFNSNPYSCTFLYEYSSNIKLITYINNINIIIRTKEADLSLSEKVIFQCSQWHIYEAFALSERIKVFPSQKETKTTRIFRLESNVGISAFGSFIPIAGNILRQMIAAFTLACLLISWQRPRKDVCRDVCVFSFTSIPL